MSTTIDTIFKITASVVGSNAIKELANQVDDASTSGQKLAKNLRVASVALKAFAASEAVRGIKQIIQQGVQLGSELENVSQQTGISVQSLAQLKGMSDSVGMSLGGLGTTMNNLNKSIVNSQKVGSRQAGAFKALGIETTDLNGKLKTADQIIFEISDKFQQFDDGAGKSAIAMDLMGSKGADLIPVLNEGGDAIKELGYEVGPNFGRDSAEFSANVDRMKRDLGQVGIEITESVIPGLASMSTHLADNNVAVKLLTGTIKVIETALLGWMAVGSTVTGEIGRQFAQLQNDATALWKTMKAVATFDFKEIKNISADAKAMENTINQESADAFKQKMKAYQKTINDIWGMDQPNKRAPGPANNKPQLDYTPAGGSGGGGAADRAADGYKRAAEEAAKWIAKQRENIITLQQETDYIGLSSIEITKLKDARQIQAEVAERAANMTREQADAFRDEAAAIEEARQAVLEYNYEQQRTFGAGAKEFLAEYMEAAGNNAEHIKKVMTGAFKGAEDALIQFTTTGKINFKAFAKSIIDDMLRIAAQKAIAGIAGSLFGGFGGSAGAGAGGFLSSIFGGATASANGNIMTGDGPLPLRKYSKGGIARKPQLSLFGEGSQPEAYVPLPDGRTIPVTMEGGSGGNSPINVVVNVDANTGEESASGGDSDAQQFGRKLGQAIKSTILEEKRPGGLLYTPT